MIEVVHQLVASLAPNDAISEHTRQLHRLMQSHGVPSYIWYEAAHGEARGQGGPFAQFSTPSPASGSLLLYQLSTGSGIGDWLADRPEPTAVDYHNITPVSLFSPWEPIVGGTLMRGRRQLRLLAPRFIAALADSSYNTRDLWDAGCRRTEVAPVLFDLDVFDGEVDASTRSRLEADKATGGADWLFVGRIAPNKCQHELVQALAVYRRLVDPNARLRLVGGLASDSYRRSILRLAAELGVAGAVDLVGEVPVGVLAAYYRASDVFVCLSVHEGFCVPLIEAMYHELPVVAYRAGAVPETLRSAGLLLRSKRPLEVALAVARIVEDRSLAAQLVAAGRTRSAEFALDRTRERMWAALAPILAGDAAG